LYLWDKRHKMKKPTKKYFPDTTISMVSEPALIYDIEQKTQKRNSLLKEFTYTEFKNIMQKSPFTLSDWADMLFMSERTLHRYAKDNGGFNGLQIERILLLESLIDVGNDMFGNEGFKIWLQSKPFSLNKELPKNLLTTHTGIQNIIDLLGRIQHGISA